jgi:hypothetical protein
MQMVYNGTAYLTLNSAGISLLNASLTLNINNTETQITNIYNGILSNTVGLTCQTTVSGHSHLAAVTNEGHYCISDTSAISALLQDNSSAGQLSLYNTRAGGTGSVFLNPTGGGSGLSPNLAFNGVQVLQQQQLGPGNASGWADSTAQSWANSLLTGLRAHGLIT